MYFSRFWFSRVWFSKVRFTRLLYSSFQIGKVRFSKVQTTLYEFGTTCLAGKKGAFPMRMIVLDLGPVQFSIKVTVR